MKPTALTTLVIALLGIGAAHAYPIVQDRAQTHAQFQTQRAQMEKQQAWIEAQIKAHNEAAEARIKAWRARMPQAVGMPQIPKQPLMPAFGQAFDKEAMQAMMETQRKAMEAQRAKDIKQMQAQQARMQKHIAALQAGRFQPPAFAAPEMPAEMKAQVEAMQKAAQARQERVNAHWRNMAERQRAARERQAEAIRKYYGG